MVKGSFILSIDVDDDTLYVREENGGYRALLKPSRKIHKVFPLVLFIRNTISKGVLNGNCVD